MRSAARQDPGDNRVRVPHLARVELVTAPHGGRYLADAGWRDFDVASRHTPLLVGGGGSIDDAVGFFRAGSIGRAVLACTDGPTAERALGAVRGALTPYLTAQGVQLDAAVWLVQASA